MKSFKIWIEQKLPAEGFNCFIARLAYSQDSSLFAYGFSSPDQQNRMNNADAFCLDATHSITSSISDILYTLIIRDNRIGRGWPVAYMITNDHSTGPIVECLQHLRDACLLVDPKQFTIDCCQAEVNAITNTFDLSKTKIQFCIFHVTQAWNKHLASVSVSGFLPAENRALRGEMMSSLQKIVYEEDLDTFHQRIVSFQEEFADQEKFMDYFVKNWCTEEKFQIWSRSYKDRQYSHMLTNNFIESWHNQLKTVFLGRARNKRMDKLTFVLVNDVEYYLTQEFERVLQGNGAMSAFIKQQRIREMEAEEVDDQAREDMVSIIPTENGNSSGDRTYQVSSFVEGSTAGYSLIITHDNQIASCSCYDYKTRHQPCKHMYLLKIHTNLALFFSPSASTHDQQQQQAPPNTQPATLTPTINRNQEMINRCEDINQTLRYFTPDLRKLGEYASEEDVTRILESYQNSLQVAQQIKDKYEIHFRRSHTQL